MTAFYKKQSRQMEAALKDLMPRVAGVAFLNSTDGHQFAVQVEVAKDDEWIWTDLVVWRSGPMRQLKKACQDVTRGAAILKDVAALIGVPPAKLCAPLYGLQAIKELELLGQQDPDALARSCKALVDLVGFDGVVSLGQAAALRTDSPDRSTGGFFWLGVMSSEKGKEE